MSKKNKRQVSLSEAAAPAAPSAPAAPRSSLTTEFNPDYGYVISDLKRINSLLCSVAYPILEQAGALAPSRLREQKG